MNIMRMMNFSERFRNWIYLCISTASFSINLNGTLIDNFKASWGLRQGDPLSHSLFILIMEGFTQLFNANINVYLFKYHDKCENIRLGFLAFVDDSSSWYLLANPL